jgi:hypothetical protein
VKREIAFSTLPWGGRSVKLNGGRDTVALSSTFIPPAAACFAPGNRV